MKLRNTRVYLAGRPSALRGKMLKLDITSFSIKFFDTCHDDRQNLPVPYKSNFSVLEPG